jgi:hypothetical protein
MSDEELRRNNNANAVLRWNLSAQQRMREYYAGLTRFAAESGVYQRKPRSRFADREMNLPLDLWDETPDP